MKIFNCIPAQHCSTYYVYLPLAQDIKDQDLPKQASTLKDQGMALDDEASALQENLTNGKSFRGQVCGCNSVHLLFH